MMLYSVNYHSKYLEEADEIRVPWNQIGLVDKFNKRLVITEIEKNNLDKALIEVDKISGDYTITCGDPSLLLTLLERNYKAFLRFPVTDWETYFNLCMAGVSDIYIDGVLGFSMKGIAMSKVNVKIRVSPQVSPNASLFPQQGQTANTFFIRPEDIKKYEGFIDVIDFKESDREKEDTLFTIYKRGSWTGDLSDLIQTLNQKVPNPYIKPEFVEARLSCGQTCKIPGHTCHLCQTQFSLTNLVVDYFSNADHN